MKPVVLVVRDGWGINVDADRDAEALGDATRLARTPVADRLQRDCPTCLLTTHGSAVGLPDGQMGNSEVGHLNLGGGRVVYQQLSRIDRAIADDTFATNEVLRSAIARAHDSGALHLMGLCSDGGVHSSQDHLVALLELAREMGVDEVNLHCFLDGRDTPPTSGASHVRALKAAVERIGVGRVATVVGRYLAMDRDSNFERTAVAYEAIVGGEGELVSDPVRAIEESYDAGVTDEFVAAKIVRDPGESLDARTVKDGDSVIFFNFRADRARQLTRALTNRLTDSLGWQPAPEVHFTCFSEYDESFDLDVAFPKELVEETLAEVLSRHGRRQFHIAETEKYAHVTYFFNGGREEPFAREDRLLVPSPAVATYDLQPEMSAPEVTRQTCERIRSGRYDFVLINYANPDMVGHTGSVSAAIRAVEATDEGVGQLIAAVEEMDGALLVTADHGNAEILIAEDGGSHTAHTVNLVELFLVGAPAHNGGLASRGVLADVAPTVLALLDLPQPEAMSGRSLLR